MKHKLMLGLGLSLLLSANSFAMEIHGGKLISHKEWTKGNVIKSSFKDIKLTAAMKHPAFGLHQDNFPSWVRVYNSAYEWAKSSVPVNTDVTVGGRSSVFIDNNDTVQKTYTITTSLYAEVPVSSNPCPDPTAICPIIMPIMIASIAEDIVTLDPQGSLEIDRSPMATLNIPTVGTADYWIDSTVLVNDSSVAFNTSSNWGSIVITDTKK